MQSKLGKYSLLAFATAAGIMQAQLQDGGAPSGGTTEPPKDDGKKKPEIVKADKPAAPTDYVEMSPQVFHFKTEKLRNEKGEEIGTGKKHPSVEIYLPVPKPDRLAEILTAGPDQFVKERELLMQAVTDQIYRVARSQINEIREKDSASNITPASLNYDKLDWTAIANMPKSERGAYAPDEEELKSFFDSYLEVMPAATNKSKEKIENHVLCFKTNFKKQRAQKEILEMFRDALAVYVSNAGEEAVEENSDVIEYYSNKLNRLLKAEETITMDDL